MLFYDCMWGPNMAMCLLPCKYEFYYCNSEFQCDEVHLRGAYEIWLALGIIN